MKRTAIAAGVAALLLAGCSTETFMPESAPAALRTETPTPSPISPPSPSPRPSPSPSPEPEPPTVMVLCPDDFVFPYGETARVDFEVRTTEGSSPLSFWEMTYGDGGAYMAENETDAVRDVFWHIYESPGSYEPEVIVSAADGLTASDTCTFDFAWTSPPPPPPPPSTRVMPPENGWDGGSGGSGGGSGDGWLGCHYNGIPMWGDVQIVDHFPDVTVQVVSHFPDLKVKEVQHFPDSCGEWRVVDHFGDFTIQFVDHFPDITIQFTNSFPGR